LNCRAVISEISNYLDGELPAAARQELERHLKECKECALVVSQTKATVELYCDAEIVELPEEVKMRLHRALRNKLGASRQA
jgi:anti-sigma factor RsiW